MRSEFVWMAAISVLACSAPASKNTSDTAKPQDAAVGRPDSAISDGGAQDTGAAPQQTVALKRLAVGSSNACGIRQSDDTLVCWGEALGANQMKATPSLPFVAAPNGSDKFSELALDDSDACALHLDGTAICWGANDSGQSDAPAAQHFVEISTSGELGCGLDAQGAATCWGTHGVLKPPSGAFMHLTAGPECTCALTKDRDATCWGPTAACQDFVPAPAGEKFSLLAVGYTFACGLRLDGSPLCWGMVPAATPSEKLVRLSASSTQVCGLRLDGTAVCWLMTGSRATNPPPAEVFGDVRAGDTFACGLRKSDSTVLCWGDNRAHQSEPPAQ